jgi:hypothetical protein
MRGGAESRIGLPQAKIRRQSSSSLVQLSFESSTALIRPRRARPPSPRCTQGCPEKRNYPRNATGPAAGTISARHGRACPGHPRRSSAQNLQSSTRQWGVDGRDKPGHDAHRLQKRPFLQPIFIPRTAMRCTGRRGDRAPKKARRFRRASIFLAILRAFQPQARKITSAYK